MYYFIIDGGKKGNENFLVKTCNKPDVTASKWMDSYIGVYQYTWHQYQNRFLIQLILIFKKVCRSSGPMLLKGFSPQTNVQI